MPVLVPLVTDPPWAFADSLARVWAAGDAVLPVDYRLPPPARQKLLAALGAGEAVEVGDALVVPTSGTTGSPRGVVLTHSAVEASARATSAALEVDPAADAWLSVLPLAHIGGLSVVTRSMSLGMSVVYDWADPRATLTSVVATQLQRHDVSRFRRVLVGGSEVWTGVPANVVRTYGMTETGSGVVYDGYPIDGVELRVVDGEVWVRGPMLLRCYRSGVDPKTADGWLPTGDAGSLADDGRLTVHGRIAEVIVTGGEKVWPDAVERVLRGCAGVGDVAVAGRPDAEWGERVVAFVVAADGAAPPTLDALRGVVKDVLPAWCAPKELVLVESLPKTALGKVRRRDLV